MAVAGGRNDARMRDPAATPAAHRPCRRRTSACRSRRTEAPPVSPASQDGGRDGWLSDLLNRTDAGAASGQAPRGRARAAGPANPLESLSLDIGRLMDRNLAAEMWDRYQRGESKAFTKRLYTPGRPEGVRRSRPQISRRPRLQADGRPLHRRVRAAARRGRARRSRPAGAARSPHLGDRPGLHPARACGGTAGVRPANHSMNKKTEASRPPFCFWAMNGMRLERT